MALQKEEVSSIIEQFKINEHDTGSVPVQIALLTYAINELNDHCTKHPKDFSTQRGLLKKVNQRKRFLAYIKEKSVHDYRIIIGKLGLRK